MDLEAPAAAKRAQAMSWVAVLAVQDWVQLVVLAVTAGIIAAATDKRFYSRPFLTYDATISFPVQPSIIPYWVAVVVPLVAGLLSFAAGEYILNRRSGIKGRTALFLHFIIDFLSALAATLAVTQALKVSVGRLRPSFLAACNPAPINQPVNVTAFGQAASLNPGCTSTDSDLYDEHYSFPSGHTSTAFVMCIYSAIYCAWAFSWRVPRASVAAARIRSLGARLGHDAVALAGMLWIALQIAFAWGVGASRVRDFHHHASDVAAGALLGTLFGAVFALRGIGRRELVLAPEGGEEGVHTEEEALRAFG